MPSARSRLLFAVLAPVVLQACATKGFVRREIATSRSATDSAIVAERDARIAADNEMAARITSLRSDLDNIRTEFGAKITSIEGALKFAMPVTFAFDDATVTGEAQPMLAKFVQVAKSYYPQSVITIEGFADPAGSVSYNLGLSRRRADNVAATLQSLGLGNAMRTVGYGEARLVNQGAAKDDIGAQANRRVVFVIESAGPEAAIALGPEIKP